jgi:hypothetical protein
MDGIRHVWQCHAAYQTIISTIQRFALSKHHWQFMTPTLKESAVLLEKYCTHTKYIIRHYIQYLNVSKGYKLQGRMFL